jgi:Domain of unknown function (DUF4190)
MRPSGPPMAASTNGYAIASLVCSIVCFFGIGSLLGIIFGVKARREISASRGYQSGDGLALAGIIIGIVTLVVSIVVIGLWISLLVTVNSAIHDSPVTGTQQAVTSCTSDAKIVEVALEAAKDAPGGTGAYPAPPAPWSAGSYEGNYAVLTSPAGGERFLVGAPATTDYVIEFDAQGNVWVAPPGTYETAYDPQQDPAANPDACQVAVG